MNLSDSLFPSIEMQTECLVPADATCSDVVKMSEKKSGLSKKWPTCTRIVEEWVIEDHWGDLYEGTHIYIYLHRYCFT